MTKFISRALARIWPRSLFSRLALILFGGLAATHIFSFAVVTVERSQVMKGMMLAYVAKDVSTAVAVLERVPPSERPAWLARLQRQNYGYVLGMPLAAGKTKTKIASELIAVITPELGPSYNITDAGVAADDVIVLNLLLKDGTPLRIELVRPTLSVSIWVPGLLSLQLLLLGFATWLAVRIAARPLGLLADAADGLGSSVAGKAPLPEDGPREVARAAAAFNAMQRRIAGHMAEQLHIIAAISHDLQTPITRMRLRADLLDDVVLREKLHADLNAMQHMVEDGIAYARSAHGTTEPASAVDLYALLDSVICDFGDAGQKVELHGQSDCRIVTRPHTLRRVLTNLVDNALKFGTDAQIQVEFADHERAIISVCDRGPGIPCYALESVFEPFRRLEISRSRETGGTGLGLAIARQLTATLDGSLVLTNRQEGGLRATLSIPVLPRACTTLDPQTDTYAR